MAEADIDGRFTRRERNRLAVVDAMLALFDEGDLEPPVSAVAARSGVSERSIFRYFENRDDLRQECIRRNFDRVWPLLIVADQGSDALDDRIRWLVETRLELWGTIAGAARAARIRAPFKPDIAASADRYRKLLDEQVRELLKAELASLRRSEADQLVLMIDVILSFDAWDLMVGAYNRTRRQVRAAWVHTLSKLLSDQSLRVSGLARSSSGLGTGT